eukprot:226689_1
MEFTDSYIIHRAYDDNNEPHTPSSESDSNQDNVVDVQIHDYSNTMHHVKPSPYDSLPCTPCSDSDSNPDIVDTENIIHSHDDTNATFDDADHKDTNAKHSYQKNDCKGSKRRVDMHVPSFISSPFIPSMLERDVEDPNMAQYYATQKGEQYISCYIYYIQFKDDPYHNTPIALITPNPIHDVYLPSISFSVQTRKDEEIHWKQLIAEWVIHKREFCDSLQFDRKYIHTTMISLHCVKSKGNANEHKLKESAFGNIKKCNKSIFERLYQWTLCDALYQHKGSRFYYICPLKETFSGLDDMEIHYEYVERICLGHGLGSKRLNAKTFRKAVKSYCNLKNELVEIDDPNKKNKQLAMSYGVDKEKFNRIRQNRTTDVMNDDDDTKSVISIATLASFPDQDMMRNVDKVKQINKRKLYRKAGTLDIILARHEIPTIENVLLTVNDKDITGFGLQCKMIYPTINNVYPTGIASNLWYKLKTLPAILYRIETKLRVIDCAIELLPFMEQKDNEFESEVDMNSVLTLVFEAIHRSKLTTKRNYEILKYFGSTVLKFGSILHSFVTDPFKNVFQMNYDLIKHSHKRHMRNLWNVFVNAAQEAQLLRFAVLKDFDCRQWHPPQFAEFKDHSLHNAAQCNDALETELLQAIIGGTFIALTQSNQQNESKNIGYAINESFNLLKDLKILRPNIESVVRNSNLGKEVNHKLAELQMKLKAILATDKLQMNAMFQKSLETVVHGNSKYRNDGITFDRLSSLGDAVQELLVGFNICNSLISHLFGKQVSTNNTGKEIWIKHFNFSEYITEKRDMLVNNKYLGYQFVKEGLDEYISWFDQNTRAKIRKLENNTETPGAHVDAHTVSVLANCAKCYKAFVGAIFVGSNPDIFKTEAPVSWKIHHCDQFIKHMLSGSTYDQMMSIELSELN